jgi:hypothetical protein
VTRVSTILASSCAGVVTASQATALILKSNVNYVASRCAVIELPGISLETLFVIGKRFENDADGKSSAAQSYP